MTEITLDNIRHSYPAARDEQRTWALQEVNQVWEDGGAFPASYPILVSCPG